jgi:hypothetical protein
VGTRTPDLYRVKSEVKLLQPFSCLAFPFSQPRKTALKPPIFGDELVTSFVQINLSDPYFLRKGFWHTALANDWREFRPHKALSRKEMFMRVAGVFAYHLLLSSTVITRWSELVKTRFSALLCASLYFHGV